MTPRDLERLHAVRQRREQQAANASALQRQGCAQAAAVLAQALEESQALHTRMCEEADALHARAVAGALPVRQWDAAQAQVEAQREGHAESLEAVEAARQAHAEQLELQAELDGELRRCQRRLQAWTSLMEREQLTARRAEECNDEQEQGDRPWAPQEMTR